MAPPACGSGKGYMFSTSDNTCTCQDTTVIPISGVCTAGVCTPKQSSTDSTASAVYATLEDCLCCECGTHSAKYCPGAAVCSPPSLVKCNLL